MLIQAYLTASIQSRQVVVDMTKSHLPGYLGNRMLMYFPSVKFWYKDYLGNKARGILQDVKSGLHEGPLRISLPIKPCVLCLHSSASTPVQREIVYVEVWSRETIYGLG